MPIKSVENHIQEAKNIFDQDANADQVVFLYTAANNRRVLINHNVLGGCNKDTCDLLETLRKEKDTEIRYMLCIWRELCLDIPSIYLRNQLIKLNPLNNDTIIITKAERTLKSTLPK